MSQSFPNDRLAKRNIAILIILSATIGGLIPMHFLLGGLAGRAIAPSPAWATLPISATIIGSMLTAARLSRVMARYGRPVGFVGATLIALIGLLICAYSAQAGNFALFVFGSLLIGAFVSANGLFRFAATDAATPEFRPRAISFTLLGGIAAAIIGPEIGGRFSNPNIAVPYVIFAVIALIAVGLFFLLRLPQPQLATDQAIPRLAPYFRRRNVLAAMIISISAYAIMNLMMTSTPLAVEGVGFHRAHSAHIVRAHVLAMFVPSFFTGYLIGWFGLRRVVITGVIILIAASLVALSGIALHQFYIALILLGIGWNFAFIGGTTMLVNAIDDPAVAKNLQGVNDTILWSAVALASLFSGYLMNGLGDGGARGWHYVNYAMLPVLTVALVLGLWLTRREAKAVTA